MQFLKIKNRKKFTILASLSLISLAYIYSSLTSHRTNPLSPSSVPTPTTKLQTTNPIFNNLKTPDITLSPNINFSQFPSSLNVYTTSLVNPNDLRSQATPLITFFHLTPSPSQSIVWTSSDKTQTLYLDYSGHAIQYSYSYSAKPGASLPTTPLSMATVKKFLNSIPEFSGFSLQENQIKFYKIQGESNNYEETISANGADFISIPATQLVDNFAYRDAALNTPPLFFLLGQNNTILKIIYTPQPLPQYSSPQSYPVISSQQLVDDLKNNQAAIISAPIYALPSKLTDLPSITIANIKIEYRYDHQKSRLTPYFLLEGTYHLDTADTPESLIQLILPAIHATP